MFDIHNHTLSSTFVIFVVVNVKLILDLLHNVCNFKYFAVFASIYMTSCYPLSGIPTVKVCQLVKQLQDNCSDLRQVYQLKGFAGSHVPLEGSQLKAFLLSAQIRVLVDLPSKVGSPNVCMYPTINGSNCVLS